VPDRLAYLYAALPARAVELHGGDDLIPGVSNASGNEADVLRLPATSLPSIPPGGVTQASPAGGFLPPVATKLTQSPWFLKPG
jgi:hypothetical protein